MTRVLLILIYIFAAVFLPEIIYAQHVEDKTILITAPSGYAGRFSQAFESTSISPVSIPMIETVLEGDISLIDSLLLNLKDYDWVAFSSRKAIDAFANRLMFYPAYRDSLKNTHFCAIGKDADYMFELLGVRNAIDPDEPSPKGIASKLARISGIKGQRIAVLVPEVVAIPEPDVVPDFINSLEVTGLFITRINAYQTRPVSQFRQNEAKALIFSGHIACIAFTSSAEIEVLLQQFPNQTLPEDILIACFGPYTAAYAKKKGLSVSVIAKDFSSFEGFKNAILDHFYQK